MQPPVDTAAAVPRAELGISVHLSFILARGTRGTPSKTTRCHAESATLATRLATWLPDRIRPGARETDYVHMYNLKPMLREACYLNYGDAYQSSITRLPHLDDRDSSGHDLSRTVSYGRPCRSP